MNPLFPLPKHITNAWVTQHMLSVPMSWAITWDEVKEVAEELATGQFKAAAQEVWQVLYCLQLLAFSKCNLTFSMWGCYRIVRQHAERHSFWAPLLQRYNLPWSMQLFQEGTNWRRPQKIVSVLARGNVYITRAEAQTIIDSYAKNQVLPIIPVTKASIQEGPLDTPTPERVYIQSL